MPMTVASRNAEFAAWLSLSAAVLYAALAGFTVPTQRALIMLAVAQTALVSRRTVDMSSGLSAAVLLVLARDSSAPLSASFWLSLAAVALLWQLARTDRYQGVGCKKFGQLVAMVRVQWGIGLGLVPVTALFFNEVSLISPFVNMVAIPLFSLILVPLTLAAAAALFVLPVGDYVAVLPGTLLQWTWNGLAAVGELPWAAVTLAPRPGWVVAISALGAAAALAAYPLPARKLAWVVLVPVFWWEPVRPDKGGAGAILEAFPGTRVLMGPGGACVRRLHRFVVGSPPRAL